MAIQVINQSQSAGTTLGYAQITSAFSTSSTTAVQVTGLTATVTIPAGGRRVRISAVSQSVALTSGSSSYLIVGIWDGTVGSGTLLSQGVYNAQAAVAEGQANAYAVVTPAAGSKTYNISLSTSAGSTTARMSAGATFPAYIQVELV